MQPERGCAGKAQGHGLSPCRRERAIFGVPENFRSPPVGDDESRLRRHDLLWHLRRYGEIKPIAEGFILRPFLIRLEIGKTGLDLDGPQGPRPD